MFAPLASASLVFAILYLAIFVGLTVGLSTKRIKIKSRWAVLYLHVLCRLAAQACGLSLGLIGIYAGPNNVNVLIAMYILGAEGYFTLVLCTARFLVSWHNHHFGDSWLERKSAYPKHLVWYKKFGRSLSFRGIKDHPMTWVEWCLIAANAIIISGGSLSAGAYTNEDLTQAQERSQLQTSRNLRTAGQAIFLAINCTLFGCIVATVHQARSRRNKKPWYGHPTLGLLLLTWPFLATRGIWGILQAQVPEYNVSPALALFTPLQANSSGNSTLILKITTGTI